MTEKRFESRQSINKTGYVVTDNRKQYTFPVMSENDCFMFCKVLNALHEENRGLQRHLDVMRSGALTDDKRIKELYDKNEHLKQRNDRQYNQLKQLWELIEDEDYNTLRSMLNQRETDEKLLQKEWGTYSD